MKDENRALNSQGSSAAPQREATSEPVTVKKYANRRLYNTATSSYVTLENLATMARDGVDFEVLDAKTGEDITRSVLTQIIFEEESRGREPLLPTSFLRQLIKLYGHTLQGYVPGYLEATMQAFERNQESFRAQMERSFGQTPGFMQFDAMARANIEMFRKAMSMFATSFNEKDAGEPGGGADADDQRDDRDEADQELETLRQELLEMQRKVDLLMREQADK